MVRMRASRYLFVFTLVLAASSAAQSPVSEPAAVLAAAREALGGEKRLGAVRSFTATGRTRQVRGENLVPIEFEIVCELPDKFVRKDEVPAQESGPTSLGFNGEQLIQDPPPAPPRPPKTPPAGSSAPPPAAADAAGRSRLATLKQDFARLALGMFAASFSGYPLTFSHAGLAEAPQGKADVMEAKGPANFTLRFFVHTQTHLPVMVTWLAPVTPANIVIVLPGQPPSAPVPGSIVVEAPPPPPETATKEERDKYANDIAALRKKTLAEAKPIEHRLYYSDYRDVDGMQFPFRLRRAVAGQTTEETTFDRFRINP